MRFVQSFPNLALIECVVADLDTLLGLSDRRQTQQIEVVRSALVKGS